MNIFATYSCPYKSAVALDDRRLNKMIVETLQMMAIAMEYHGAPRDVLPKNKNGAPYKTKGHRYHPCSVWCRETRGNYMWLFAHLIAMYDERHRRPHKSVMDDKPIHAVELGLLYIPEGKQTPFVNSTNHHKHIDYVHEAYRLEMEHKWANPKVNAKTGYVYRPTWSGSLEFPGWRDDDWISHTGNVRIPSNSSKVGFA